MANQLVLEQDYQLGQVPVIQLANQRESENQLEQDYQLVLEQDYQLVLEQDYQLVLEQDYQLVLEQDYQLAQCHLLSCTDNRYCRWQAHYHCQAE